MTQKKYKRMKHLILFTTCLIFSLSVIQAQVDRTQPPKPGKAAKIQLGDYQIFKLENGLTAILVENHELPVVTFSLQMALEPVAEGKMAGAASFAGQLLRAGTTTRTKAQLDKEIDFIGASISTGQSSIGGSSLKKHQSKVLELMTDVLYNPVFPQEEFDKLKKQTLAALAMASTDPNSMASTVANVLRYGKEHPYGEATTEETIENITLDAVKDFYKTYFTPSIGYFIMIGDLNLNEAKQIAGQYFSQWKSTPVNFKKVDNPAPFNGNRVAFVEKSGAVQSVITITNTLNLKPGDPDVLPAMLMNNILGGGVFSGRLMMNLREDKAYTYGAGSSLSTDRLIGNFSAAAQVGNAVTDSAITQFLFEMRRLRDEPVSEEDLRLTKNVMAGEFGRALESPTTMASFALNTVRYNLPSDYYATYLERLEKITIADVQAMAKKYLQPDNCIILVVGNKAEVANKLTGFAASGEIEFYDRYGNPESAMDIPLPEGLTAKDVIGQYLDATGGKQVLKKITNVTIKATGKVEAMGQSMELGMTTIQVSPDLFYQEMKMGEMVLSKQVFNGKEAWVTAMGGTQDISGEELEKMRDGALLFPELNYFNQDFVTTLEGIESVNGQKTYRIKVVYPSSLTDTEYYDINTGLKIRKMSRAEMTGQTVETITDFADYREISGIKFPFSMKQQVSGQVIDIQVDQVDTTTVPDPSLFKK
jgi:zinc protease